MTSAPPITLSDGKSTPQLGLGVRQMTDDEATTTVSHVLGTGYRYVDTAAIYRSEMGVGHAIAASLPPRDEILVITKLWSRDQGHDLACPGLKQSLEKLGLDYVGLYLIHWPCPACGVYVETQEQLIDFRSEGLVRPIEVCNFLPEYLDTIVDETGITLVVDQTELHPIFQPDDLIDHCSGLRITAESWSPLGWVVGPEHPVITRIAEWLGATLVQVIIRWYLDRGPVAIPKLKILTWIESSLVALEVKLSVEDWAAIGALSAGNRIGSDSAISEMI